MMRYESHGVAEMVFILLTDAGYDGADSGNPT